MAHPNEVKLLELRALYAKLLQEEADAGQQDPAIVTDERKIRAMKIHTLKMQITRQVVEQEAEAEEKRKAAAEKKRSETPAKPTHPVELKRRNTDDKKSNRRQKRNEDYQP